MGFPVLIVCVRACVCVLISGIILNSFPYYYYFFLRQDLSLGLGLTDSATLIGQ